MKEFFAFIWYFVKSNHFAKICRFYLPPANGVQKYDKVRQSILAKILAHAILKTAQGFCAKILAAAFRRAENFIQEGTMNIKTRLFRGAYAGLCFPLVIFGNAFNHYGKIPHGPSTKTPAL